MKIYKDIKTELKRYNVEWVAKQAKVAPATLYFWLDGKTKAPRIDTLCKVAKVLDYHIRLVKGAGRLKIAA